MNIANKTVLITGANRGIGRALVDEALRRGAKRVYAGTRSGLQHADKRVVRLTLDLTNASQIERAVDAVQRSDHQHHVDYGLRRPTDHTRLLYFEGGTVFLDAVAASPIGPQGRHGSWSLRGPSGYRHEPRLRCTESFARVRGASHLRWPRGGRRGHFPRLCFADHRRELAHECREGT